MNYIHIGNGESCIGTSGGLNEIGEPDKQIEYDLLPMHDPLGRTINDTNFGPNKFLTMTICGSLSAEGSKCGGSEDWCFEETDLNKTCIKGIANWLQNFETGGRIDYFAICYVI